MFSAHSRLAVLPLCVAIAGTVACGAERTWEATPFGQRGRSSMATASSSDLNAVNLIWLHVRHEPVSGRPATGVGHTQT